MAIQKFNNVDASKLIEGDFNYKSYARISIQCHQTDRTYEFEHAIIMVDIDKTGFLTIRIYDVKEINPAACITFTTWANKANRVPRISASNITLVRYD